MEGLLLWFLLRIRVRELRISGMQGSLVEVELDEIRKVLRDPACVVE